MIERRPLGTGPRPSTETPPMPGPRSRLAAELAGEQPAQSFSSKVPASARRRLGAGPGAGRPAGG
ncbi:hypothetical protein [Streptomyces sp. NBC_00354]|uniref:hypothetical protein n=1 Tax=Streptomyces sp. NBC_00354 TaxID=2975723 RepID=UPI002E271D55|nr:hypothetical protein OG296_41285 [Streptomyces sp. NBC_01001]